MSTESVFLNNYHHSTNADIVEKLVSTVPLHEGSGRVINSEHAIGGYKGNAPDDPSTAIASTKISADSNLSIATATGFNRDALTVMTSDSMLADPEAMLTNRFNMFSRYGYIDPTHELVSGAREYLFFSKPDLHLMDVKDGGVILNPQLASNPFFREAFDHYRFSFYSLQQWYGYNSHPFQDFETRSKFIPLLSNMVTSSFDLSDISANEVQGNQNLYQINTSYREGSITADLQYDFSLEFKDTKYLDVYMLFKIYDEYFRYKYEENITPNRKEYSQYKIVPEAFSIWKVIVDDTSRIIFWAKATGVTAMSVPRGAVSNLDGTIKFTVNFKTQFLKDMDPIHLLELNNLAVQSMTSIGKAYSFAKDVDEKVWPGKRDWVAFPFVKMLKFGSDLGSFTRTGDVSGKPMYRLFWRVPNL